MYLPVQIGSTRLTVIGLVAVGSGARLDLYDNGFVVYRGQRVRTVRYDTTSVKAMVTRHTGAQQNHISYDLTFTDVNGAKFLLHQGFHPPPSGAPPHRKAWPAPNSPRPPPRSNAAEPWTSAECA
ncbi:hypothetical protein JK358_08910 [Nocardia sp. 2]|uniref:Uncharacterized protein n=1 Tax=Nocardia acididurans TaxID=2802282 RepID=A0ABS1M1X7_9NOCA|nr:hypothetical protein [Nocardia acididurans]MBL1074516.1 hypothetical protein [Nocardia acididurans]